MWMQQIKNKPLKNQRLINAEREGSEPRPVTVNGFQDRRIDRSIISFFQIVANSTANIQ